MKAFNFNMTMEQMANLLSMDAYLIGSLNEAPLVAKDMDICLDWINRTDEEVRAQIGIDYTAQDLTASTIFVAIRKRGVEFGSKEEVKSRCKTLGEPVVVYKIDLVFGSNREVQISKRVA